MQKYKPGRQKSKGSYDSLLSSDLLCMRMAKSLFLCIWPRKLDSQH